jgi:putative oxidoreductase
MMDITIKDFFKSSNSNIALLVLRIVIGVSFAIHGYPKISSGIEMWTRLGGAMSHIGIELVPVFWGFWAAFFEFFGGIFLVLGVVTRFASGGLVFTMFIAAMMHFSNGDPLNKILHPLELFAVCLFFFLSGPGKYSLDQMILKKWFNNDTK